VHVLVIIIRLYCIDLFICIAASLFNKRTYLLTYLLIPGDVIKRTRKPESEIFLLYPIFYPFVVHLPFMLVLTADIKPACHHVASPLWLFSTCLESIVDHPVVVLVFDHLIFVFFAVEMLVKMTAMGVVGKKAYLGETWNRLDMFIVLAGFVCSFVSLPFCICYILT